MISVLVRGATGRAESPRREPHGHIAGGDQLGARWEREAPPADHQGSERIRGD